ncbi:unnamed protein product, partial [Ilex paraguariensis]
IQVSFNLSPHPSYTMMYALSLSQSHSVKSHKDLVHFETAYVVKLHRVARLSPSQPVFTFTHPNYSTKKSNHRYKKLQFEISRDTGSAMVHGMWFQSFGNLTFMLYM